MSNELYDRLNALERDLNQALDRIHDEANAKLESSLDGFNE